LYEVRANQVTATDQHEPTLAVDPTNPNNVLAAAKDWRTGPKQVWHYRSTDSGRSWTDGHITTFPTELPNQSDPVLAYDASGTAYMSVLAYNQNDFSIGGLFVSRSDDKGATWQQPVLVSANSLELFNDKEWLTTDRSSNPATRGNVYTTWTLFTRQGRNERGEIMLSRSTDGGKSFSGRVLVSLPEQTNTQGSYPAVGPDGALYVLYYNGAEDSGGLEGLYVARSTDGGQTFPQVRLAASVVSPPSPLPGSSFRVFVLPTLAVDPRSGALHVTWNDYRAGDSDVMLTTSTDDGSTWSEPLRVNDDPSTPAHDQFFPTAIVGTDGTLHLVWLDRRDDPENVNYLPYYATSTDGGKSVTKNLPVSRTRSDPDIGFEGVLIGDYIAVDVSGDGRSVYAAWVDTRNGDQDIFFAQFPTQSGPAPPNAPALVIRPTPVAVPSPQPLTGFTDEAFLRSWERADRPVARGRANRPWLWGPVSFGAALEAYAEGRSGTREVQYFDKARMEINDPTGEREGPFFVTNGLLVVELIGGRVQTGDAKFEPVTRPASQVPVAGDINSPDALTYASLVPVASLNNDKRANDRTGQPVIATLDRAGRVRDDPTRGGTVRIARYEPVLGHNIPDVFWSFMNATGPVYNGRLGTYSEGSIVNWITDLGYPITEPYWTNVRIGGASKWVMLQAFQRRVLTFVPDNPPGWQVEMGNVGRHYFDWRYKTVPSPKSRVQSQRTTDAGRQTFDSGLRTLDSGLWTNN
jgi:hypothetical protein